MPRGLKRCLIPLPPLPPIPRPDAPLPKVQPRPVGRSVSVATATIRVQLFGCVGDLEGERW